MSVDDRERERKREEQMAIIERGGRANLPT